MAGYDLRCDIPEKPIHILVGWKYGRDMGTVRRNVSGDKNGSGAERISGNLLFPGGAVAGLRHAVEKDRRSLFFDKIKEREEKKDGFIRVNEG